MLMFFVGCTGNNADEGTNGNSGNGNVVELPKDGENDEGEGVDSGDPPNDTAEPPTDESDGEWTGFY